MQQADERELKWLTKHYGSLTGATIKSFHVARDESGLWPQLHLVDGRVIEVSRDPEGNGPGFLFIGNLKEDSDA